MAWKQLITPNLDNDPKKPVYIWVNGKIASSWVGWCLAAVKASYGATKSMGTALNAWNQDQTKHSGSYDLPNGLYVPIYWKGDKDGFGHVAIAKRNGDNVEIWSSPTAKQGGATFVKYNGNLKSTIDSTTRTYGCTTYLGWTERVCEKTVVQATNLKSNEEICAEIWQGLWGTGTDRKNRLTAAGYDYGTIQKMVDAGVGKPQKAPEPTKEEEPKSEPTPTPEPTQDGSDEATEPTEEASSEPISDNDSESSKYHPNSSEDSEKKNEETKADETQDEGVSPAPFVPANPADTKFVEGLIEEAGSVFNPSPVVKMIAYLVGDTLLLAAVLVPDIINIIQAPTLSTMGEYLSRTLMEAGVFILLVFKLIKKGKK